jgi:periplasmic mercuric ion binding protein
MKLLMVIIVFALIQTAGFSQTASSETVEFKVYGNCGMCKTRIEKALNVEGVESAKWDKKTNMVSVVYDSKKLNEDKLHKLAADAGHDTEKFQAKDETYNKLHGCCKYERHEEVSGKESETKNNSKNHKH